MTRIAVFGAGAIGCYIGGRLAVAGGDVRFVGRAATGEMLREHGLTLNDYLGREAQVAPERIAFDTDPRSLADAEVVLVSVKCTATPAAAAALEPVLRPGTVVISFQNGVRQADALRIALPARTVLAGMVPFNVIARGDGLFHQGSGGQLVVEASPHLARIDEVFDRAVLPLRHSEDILAVQWAKLLLNLNNAVNALSALPLREQLAQRDYRRCLALAQREALRVLRRAGLRPAWLTLLPPGWMPGLLSLPDALFSRLANSMLEVDPLARSSMADDLSAGRSTEIDWLNGEIVRLAAEIGMAAPVNARLRELVLLAGRDRARKRWRADVLLHTLLDAAGEAPTPPEPA
ncbi:2-dehydropantoate 2-reductase [Burkholderia gladioli]|uniref:2-dehydropantoate 2-reductase n=1 Tax=Burkholderia gladioli TaxID=28095 RepID=UPI001C2101A0|nr:2-dehydropantoate 2-reductase [Burkholderia gladioli]